MYQRFRNRYRISSTRLQNRDYGKNGAYFITICTHQRLHYFGNIDNSVMALSPISQPKSLQAIIHSYKAAVTRKCRKNGHNYFGWQPRYYNRIIRNDGSINRIQQYIADNPRKWNEDVENPSGLWM